jgi:predicted nucleic acid-binding protein
VAALVDTNVLVYRYDPRFPAKQKAATELLRKGTAEDSIRVPHQCIVEFVSVMQRLAATPAAIMTLDQARWEAEALLDMFPILYPNEDLVRSALRGAAAYQLSWFDAHLWAYAETFGLGIIYSEDFQHGRYYGSVRTLNPFEGLG